MIKSVEIINSYGEKIKMVLDDPELNGYAITNISGIEPVQVDIKQTQLVSGLKYKYNFGFYKSREITFNIVYLEWLRDEDDGYIINRKIEEARDNLYKYFKTNDKIQMIFERGRRDGLSGTQLFHIEGYVNKHQPTFFSQNCGATISVTCPDPWFKECWWTGDPSNPVLNFTTTVESVNNGNIYINYKGDISTGFKLISTDLLPSYSGGSIVISSRRVGSSIDNIYINVPKNYDILDYLTVDLSSDIISVYSTNKLSNSFSNEYYVATANSIDNYNKGHIITLEAGDMKRFQGESPPGTTSINQIRLEVNNIEEDVLITTEFIRLEKRLLYKVLAIDYDYTNPNMTSEIDSIKHRPDHDYDIRIKLGALNNDYCYLVDNNIDTSKIYYSIPTSEGDSNNIGFVFCKKFTGYYSSEIKNHTGWIDATSLSKRKQLPILQPGVNDINFRCDKYSSSNRKPSFKIEYNTLYRGL